MTRFSVSQALLALAIAYLAFSLVKIANEIPNIVEIIDKTNVTVDKVTPQIPHILSTIDSITLQINSVVTEVASVRTLVEQQLPPLLQQVELLRPVVNGVVDESHQYSQNIPNLLTHLSTLENQITEVQKQLPIILKRVDDVVKMTNNTTAEIANWRPHSKEYIEQIKLSREDIPMYLTRTENIVTDAKTIGKEATSGLFVGILKGALTLPFDVISGLTGIVDKDSRSAKYLTALDVSLMQEETVALLNSTRQKKAVWQNTESGNRGTIIKSKQIENNNQVCHTLTFSNYFKDENEELKELMCRDDEGLWKVTE